MKIIVQKFGGSSVATGKARAKAAKKIICTVLSGYKSVVVLSAMGRSGDPFATDTILDDLNEHLPDSEPFEKDLVASLGEIYTCATMASLLRKYGMKVKVFTGFDTSVVTDSNFMSAKIKYIETEGLLEALSVNDIVLLTGFSGVTSNGIITTLGRGGSDTTAVAAAAALNAERADIYTDVEGVMTADPKLYPQARIMPYLDYMEMGEMASEGAKVLHTRCVEIAQLHNVKLCVKNTFSDCEGTSVAADHKNKQIISGLIHRTGISDFFVDYNFVNNAPKRQRALFMALAEKNISLDLINIHRKKLYFTVNAKDTAEVSRYLSNIGMKFESCPDCAKISCVGSGMKGTAGVMAQIAETLFNAGIKIYRSVDSFINISCLIKKSDLEKAMTALHGLLPDTPAKEG